MKQTRLKEKTTMKQEMNADVIKMVTPTAVTAVPAWAATTAYHELAEIPVKQIDLLESVEQNLALVEELQARLNFMVREVKYLMKL